MSVQDLGASSNPKQGFQTTFFYIGLNRRGEGFQYAQFRKHSLDTKRQDLFSDDLAAMSDYFLWQNSAMFHMVSPRI